MPPKKRAAAAKRQTRATQGELRKFYFSCLLNFREKTICLARAAKRAKKQVEEEEVEEEEEEEEETPAV